ncbi:hypothetical protein ACO2Q0_01630 [Phenylobacterium sp. VNQ135]|uniref:hypothetical protein n=1 Tax=Phenylobacterium sp. VNQ135 TaxID=3400922 RepID=UPI003C0B2B18
MIPDLPWEVHPDLTKDRLVHIGQLIAKGRHDAVLFQNEEIGDDTWVLGCRAFQATRHQILTAAASEDFPWLEIIDSSKHLVFKIGAVPVRFYKGAPEEPTVRTLRQTYPELSQLGLIFGDEREHLVYRFAVETDFDGTVAAIKFVGLLGEAPAFCWDVPLTPAMPSIFPVSPPVEGVDLGAPLVRISRDDQERGQSETG